MEQKAEITQNEECPAMRMNIGGTTYIVRIHFSETSKETMEDKIKRMLKNEAEQMDWLSEGGNV